MVSCTCFGYSSSPDLLELSLDYYLYNCGFLEHKLLEGKDYYVLFCIPESGTEQVLYKSFLNEVIEEHNL